MIENSTITFNTTNKDMQREVLRIDGEGRIFWLERQVTTDEELRAAMLELLAELKKLTPHQMH